MYPMIKKYCESVHKRPRQTRWFGRQVSVPHIYTTRLPQSHVWPEEKGRQFWSSDILSVSEGKIELFMHPRYLRMSKELTILSFSPMFFFLFNDVIHKLQDILDRNSPDIFDVPERSSADDISSK